MGLDENAAQIVGIYISIPDIALGSKVRREPRFVQDNRLFIACGQRHLLPIVPEGVAVE